MKNEKGNGMLKDGGVKMKTFCLILSSSHFPGYPSNSAFIHVTEQIVKHISTNNVGEKNKWAYGYEVIKIKLKKDRELT